MNAAPRCSNRMEYWVQGILREPILGGWAPRTRFGSAGAFHRCWEPLGPPWRAFSRRQQLGRDCRASEVSLATTRFFGLPPLDRAKLLTRPIIANIRRTCYASPMDEGRKRVLLIAASILAARKLAQYDSGARVPATVSAIADAVRWAERIMEEIDRRHPTKPAHQPTR